MALSLCLLLVGCGGGGGGGSPGSGSNLPDNPPATNPPPQIPAVVTIDSGSVAEVAATGAQLLFVAENSTGFTSEFIEGLATGLTAQSPTAAVTAKTLSSLAADSTDGAPEQCANGGFFTLSYDIQSLADLRAGTMHPGDSFITNWSNCNLGEGVVVDGVFNFVVERFQGNLLTRSYLIELAIEFVKFDGSVGADSIRLDGDLNAIINRTDSSRAVIELSGVHLKMIGNDRTTELWNYALTHRLSSFDSTLNGRGIVSDEAVLGGALEFDIPSSLITSFSSVDFGPYNGAILLNGSGNSSVVVRAVGYGYVDLEIDYDGNGSMDELIQTNWSELSAKGGPAIGTTPVITAENYSSRISWNVVRLLNPALLINEWAEVFVGELDTMQYMGSPIFTQNCTVSGSLQFNLEDANPDSILTGALSPGDSIAINWDQCEVERYSTYNGFTEFTVNAFQGDLSSNSFSTSLDISSVPTIGHVNDATFEGAISLDYNTLDPGATFLRIVGDGLKVVALGSERIRLHNFMLNVRKDRDTGAIELDGSGEIRFPDAFRDVVQFEFVEPFIILPIRDPSSGKLVITDHTGAQVIITPLYEPPPVVIQRARIEYLSGDGNESAETFMTWD